MRFTVRREDVLWDVAEEHLDEAGYLFGVWHASMRSPVYRLHEVAHGPEERLLAHLDALVLSGPAVVEELLLPALHDGDGPEQIAAAALCLVSIGPFHDDAVLARAMAAETDEGDALVQALGGWDRPELGAKILGALDKAPNDPARAVLYAALARRRQGVPAVPPAVAQHPDPLLARAVLSAARMAPRAVGLALAESRLADPDPYVGAEAMRTGLCLGSRAAWAQCELAARLPPGPMADLAWLALAQLGSPQQQDAIIAAVRDAPTRALVWAAGFTGRIEAADACLALCDHGELGALAAEAFAAIAGFDFEEGAYFRDPAIDEDALADDEIVPPEDDLDTDLEPTADDELPVPDPAALRQGWVKVRPTLDPRRRWLCGQPFDHAGLLAALRDAPMRRREALADELFIRSRGVGLVSCRAACSIQRRQLAALGALPRIDCDRSFPRIG